tara:strand:+ start:76 stop:285 length:210 start_codon:yes stop_codon:yes gene_type:complete
MKKWLLGLIPQVVNNIFKSKKFIYGLAGIVIPLLMTHFGWSEDVATQVWQTAIVLILGQAAADFGKSKK